MSMTMDDDHDDELLEVMERYGGSFAQQLARLYRSADHVNRGRLRAAFPEFWARYRQIRADLATRGQQ